MQTIDSDATGHISWADMEKLVATAEARKAQTSGFYLAPFSHVGIDMLWEFLLCATVYDSRDAEETARNE